MKAYSTHGWVLAVGILLIVAFTAARGWDDISRAAMCPRCLHHERPSPNATYRCSACGLAWGRGVITDGSTPDLRLRAKR